MSTFAVVPSPSGPQSVPTLGMFSAPQQALTVSGLLRGGFAVTPTTSGGPLGLDIAPGIAYFNGVRVAVTGTGTVYCAANPTGLARIDRVALQLNPASGTASYVVLQGTPAATPTAPTLNTGGLLQLSLCQVSVAAGAGPSTTFSMGNITDERRTVAGYANRRRHGKDHLWGGADPLGFVGDLAWPDLQGLGPVTAGAEAAVAQTLVKQTLTFPATYTPPSGYTLYLTALKFTAGTTQALTWFVSGTASGTLFGAAASSNGGLVFNTPIQVPSTGNVSIGPSASGCTVAFEGVLVRASGKATPRCLPLGQSGASTPYTVPANTWFVLTHLYGSEQTSSTAYALTWDGLAWSPGGQTPRKPTSKFLDHIWMNGSTATSLFGANIYSSTSGMAFQVPARPVLLPPGAVIANAAGTVALTAIGYTWPQTG